MFEVWNVCEKNAAILMLMSEVCVRGPIKIHIHLVLKLLIRREDRIYIAIVITMEQFKTYYVWNVCKVRENMPQFAGNADDAARTESELVEVVQHCSNGGATFEKSWNCRILGE